MNALINNSVALEPVTAITPNMLQNFIEWLDVRPKTMETYKRSLKQFFIYLQNNNIKAPLYTDIINYRESLLKDHKPATVYAYLIAVKQFFRWTECEGLYTNIARNVKAPKLDDEHRKDCLQVKQVKKVLGLLKEAKTNSITATRDYAMLMLFFSTGLRVIEVNRANVGDMRTLGEHTVLFVQGKGQLEKSRHVILPEETEEAIRAYLLLRGAVKSNDPLFVSESNNSKGERMTTRSISGIVKKSFINAGFNSDRLTAHSTRHTAITAALMNDEKLEDVKKFARHKDIETTLIYAHHTDMMKNTCSETLAKLFFR